MSDSSKIVQQAPSQLISPNASQLIFRNQSRDVPQCATNKKSQNNVSVSTQDLSHENRATDLLIPKNSGQNKYADKDSLSGFQNAPENSSLMRSRDIIKRGLQTLQQIAESNFQLFKTTLQNNPPNSSQENCSDSNHNQQKVPQKVTENCSQNKSRDTFQGPRQIIQPNLPECSFENKSTEAISSRLQKNFQMEPGRGLEKSSTENNFNLSQKLQENSPGNILEGSYQNNLPSRNLHKLPTQGKPEIISQNRVPNTTEKVTGGSRLIEISIPISTQEVPDRRPQKKNLTGGFPENRGRCKCWDKIFSSESQNLSENFSLTTSRHIFRSGSQTLQHKITENKYQDKISDSVLNSLENIPQKDFRGNIQDFFHSGVQKEPQKGTENYAENKSRDTLQIPIQEIPSKLPEGCFENKSTALLRNRLQRLRQKEQENAFEKNSAGNNLSLSQNVPQNVADSGRGSNLPALTAKTRESSYQNQLLTSTENFVRQNRISKTTEKVPDRQIETPFSTQEVHDCSHHLKNLSDGVPVDRHRNIYTDQYKSGLQKFSQKKTAKQFCFRLYTD